MKKPVIAIIGGSQEQTFKKIGSKYGCQVLFHDGKVRGGGTKKCFKNIVKKADCVVVNLGACSHVSMDIVKKLCKEMNIKFTTQEGFGASGAILTGLNKIAS